MTKFYLAPQNWDSDSYRDVYDENDIANLPDDWDADADDCDYIGEFETKEEATAEARKNDDWNNEMRPE
jgi:hypothetical protein